MQFNKGAGQHGFCAKNLSTLLGTGATGPPANVFTGGDNLGANRAAVNVGQGAPSRCCLRGSGIVQREGSVPPPMTQE